jgi:nucleoside-diphosphate-sugar epimerase
MNRQINNNSVTAVVGGAGFLGSHLVNYLVEKRQAKVLVIDNLVTGRREYVHPEATFYHHDITSGEDYLRKLFREHRVEFVFNYAAYPYIPVSFARPIHVFNVNANGAMHVINAAQEAGAKAILQVSSAEVYGEKYGDETSSSTMKDCRQQLDETAIVRPHSSYGASKAAIDYWCQCAWKERQTPVIALRQFNCIGERETHPYVVPEIISQLAKRKGLVEFDKGYVAPTVCLGNNSFRDFLYAGDQAAIAVELIERGAFGEVYNLGSETGIKIYDLAKLIGKLMGFADVEVKEDSARKRPWEIWHLQSDNGKIWKCLSESDTIQWNADHNFPITPLEEALKRTIAWYQSNGCKWPWER